MNERIAFRSKLWLAYIIEYKFGYEICWFFTEYLQDLLDDVIAILVHNYLQGIHLNDLDDFCLNTRLVMGIFYDFLYDPASVTM